MAPTKTKELPMRQIEFSRRRSLTSEDFRIPKLVEQTIDITRLQKLSSTQLARIDKKSNQQVVQPPDYKSYDDYWDAFQYVDFVHRAIIAKNASMWQHGFDTSGPEKERADELLKAIEADTKVAEGTLLAIIFGNMWWEPLYEPGKQGRLAEVKPLDPTSIAAIVSRKDRMAGSVSEWVQLDNGKEVGRWNGDELIHLRFNRYRNSVFGVGDLQAVILTVKILLYMEQKLPEIVRKRTDPTLWFMLANPGTDPPVPLADDKFREYVAGIKLREPAEDIYTGPYVRQVEEIYKSAGIAARQGLEFFLTHFKRKMQSGLAAPDVILGEGRMTTEATSDSQQELFFQDIRSKQRPVKRMFEMDIFPRERPPLENTKIEFNPLTPKDMNALSQRLQGEVARGIIGPQFARKELGYDEATASVGAQTSPSQPPPIAGGFMKSSEEIETVIEKPSGKPYAVIRRIPRKR